MSRSHRDGDVLTSSPLEPSSSTARGLDFSAASFFALTGFYNKKIGSSSHFLSEVGSHFLLAQLPHIDEIESITSRYKVVGVVSAVTYSEMAGSIIFSTSPIQPSIYAERLGANHVQVNIPDLTADVSLETLLDVIVTVREWYASILSNREESKESKENTLTPKVLVHCKAGRSRSAMLTAILLACLDLRFGAAAMSMDEAVEAAMLEVKQARSITTLSTEPDKVQKIKETVRLFREKFVAHASDGLEAHAERMALLDAHIQQRKKRVVPVTSEMKSNNLPSEEALTKFFQDNKDLIQNTNAYKDFQIYTQGFNIGEYGLIKTMVDAKFMKPPSYRSRMGEAFLQEVVKDAKWYYDDLPDPGKKFLGATPTEFQTWRNFSDPERQDTQDEGRLKRLGYLFWNAMSTESRGPINDKNRREQLVKNLYIAVTDLIATHFDCDAKELLQQSTFDSLSKVKTEIIIVDDVCEEPGAEAKEPEEETVAFPLTDSLRNRRL